jgi:serine/threonine-protein kinase RsbW
MPNRDTIHLDLPASHKYLNVLSASIAAMLERAETPVKRDELTYNLQLAVHEICTNIVEHAYQGQPAGRIKITLTLSAQLRQFTVDLADTGRCFDPAAVSAPDLDTGQVRGYGLFLIEQLLDIVTYQPQPDHNHWHLVKNL